MLDTKILAKCRIVIRRYLHRALALIKKWSACDIKQKTRISTRLEAGFRMLMDYEIGGVE